MSWLLALLLLAAMVGFSWPLGRYMRWCMDPSPADGHVRRRIDALLQRVTGARGAAPADWRGYAVSLLAVNSGMFVLSLGLLALQHRLPLNPDGKGPLTPDLAFHTAASFTANTNLQHYSGEAAMSYLSQLAALMWLQFVSAATGIAAVAALARGLAGRAELGSFPLDLLRATFLVLLPGALLLALLLALAGVPMTLEGAAAAIGLEGGQQTIARGPVAAFVAIKQLGTNGGGFYGPNSAHPLENPTFASNALQTLAILLIPMATVWMFGRITGRTRHAVVLFGVMLALLLVTVGLALALEQAPTRAFAGLPVEAAPNLEGKELRLGPGAGPLWAVCTTATSNGSVDCMHDSLNPLTGLVPMVGMWLNVTFGGVGVGLINMSLYVVVAVFIAGLMVGRTPEYLGRKVETREMKLALLALLLHPLFILGGTALFVATDLGRGTPLNAGSHGFSEVLYEFSSAAANNGSGFEGLGDGTAAWNYATGVTMLLCRYLPIVLPLAIVGSLAAKRPTPETSGTLRVDTPLFGAVLLGIVLLVGALLFLPVAVLGPVAEHLAGR